jgi:hypothetical protein
MWPGSSPSAVVNGAAGMIIAALVVAALYVGRDLFMPLALAGLLGFWPRCLRGPRSWAARSRIAARGVMVAIHRGDACTREKSLR